ncbi:ribonuclease HI family protein [Atrimonas thermophila]|uniref:ribonuclease HI family protein n=1 Tax=Atrimonas thermophila TaxID=3064161 RepID=UPI00399CE76E
MEDFFCLNTKDKEVFAFTDGASKGNPGESSYAFCICNPQGKIIFEEAGYLGRSTNNAAEYWGLIKLLERAKGLKFSRITVFSDSLLLVQQIQGKYRVSSPNLKPLYQKAQRLIAYFDSFRILHIPREQNKYTDSLASGIIENKIELPQLGR